jgi:hypothetical protein
MKAGGQEPDLTLPVEDLPRRGPSPQAKVVGTEVELPWGGGCYLAGCSTTCGARRRADETAVSRPVETVDFVRARLAEPARPANY